MNDSKSFDLKPEQLTNMSANSLELSQEELIIEMLESVKIPDEMYQSSILRTTLFILYACSMYFLFGYLAYLVALLPQPIIFRVLIIIPLTLLSANGLLLMGYIGHDGIHFNLSRNKIASVIIGCFFSSSILIYLEMGFAMTHWNHHKFTNQSSDPDAAHFSQFKNLWKRLILARTSLNIKFLLDTVKMALGQSLSSSCNFPLDSKTLSILSSINIAFSLTWLTLYVNILIHNQIMGIFLVVLPTLGVIVCSSFLPYIQHSNTTKDFLYNARTLTSPIWTALHFGGNYHLEHHMYPNVPIYNLPALHNLLKTQGIYDKAKVNNIDNTFLSSFTHAWSQYPNHQNSNHSQVNNL